MPNPICFLNKCVVAFVVGIHCWLTPTAFAQGVKFERLVDTETPVPGEEEPFVLHIESWGSVGLAIDRGTVAFRGGGGFEGIYVISAGQIRPIANKQIAIPGSSSSFDSITPPSGVGGLSIDHGRIAFYAHGAYFLADESGKLVRVVDTKMSVPGRDHAFGELRRCSLSNGKLLFTYGDGRGTSGIAIYDKGEIRVIADRQTRTPDGLAYFDAIKNPQLNDDVVAFQADFSDDGEREGRGVFAYYPNGDTVVVDTFTRVPYTTGDPRRSGAFVHFGPVYAGDNYFIFRGGYRWKPKPSLTQTGGGILYKRNGEVSVFLDKIAPLPGTTRKRGPGRFVVDKGCMAFMVLPAGGGRSPKELYATRGKSLIRVIGEGDELDGRKVERLGVGDEFLSDGQIAFGVVFAPDRFHSKEVKAIYVATLPDTHRLESHLRRAQ